VDATGQTWSRQITALFLAPPNLTAGITPTLVPLTMNQDPTADPSCQWSQQLFLDETNGYSSSVTSLTLGAASLSPSIPAIFGTTRLQAWGSLSGKLCWSGVTPGTSSTVQVGMSSGLSQTLQVNFAGPVASPVKITASPASLSLSAGAGAAAKTSLPVALSDKTQTWTASVFPTNAATSWLKVSPLAGTGAASLDVSASGAGFEPGVYRATIVLQSPNAVPSTVSVPVMFVYGDSGAGATSISGIGSTASPGKLITVSGSQLANSTAKAATTPLPFSLGGVSARVNGLDAPILSTSSGEITIQVPYEAGAGPGVLGVNNNGNIAGFQMQIAPSAPGIFADSSGNLSPNAAAGADRTATLYFTGDGDVTPALLTGFAPSILTAPSNLPKSRLPVSVTVGGVPVFITFYGVAPGQAGVSQINFTIPASVPSGVQPVVVTVGAASSPAVKIQVP
jgi:uncharacterized protein (TIGR03437 family)